MSLHLPEYRDLSGEQISVMNLELDTNHVVRGAPGTGKSVLALYRAHAALRAGKDVALVMYNKTLVAYTARAAAQLGMTEARVMTLHSWFSKYFKKRYGVTAPQLAPYVFDWEGCLEIARHHGAADPATGLHVIVDEGQDFPVRAYAFLLLASASVTVFADENQRINPDENSTVRQICGAIGVDQPAELTLNYRNTNQIAKVAAHFDASRRGGVTQLADPTRAGTRPRILEAPGGMPGITGTAGYIQRVQRRQPGWTIGVLLHRKKHQRAYYDALVKAGAHNVSIYSSAKAIMEGRNGIDFTEPGVQVINHKSAKGLEFDLVVLSELQTMTNPDEIDFVRQMYVLCSRARIGLVLAHSGPLPDGVRDALPMDLLTKQAL